MRAITLLSALLMSTAASAQAEGTFPGTLFCNATAGIAAARLPISLSLDGANPTYTFPAASPTGQSSGAQEKGSGSLTAGRQLVLTGAAKGTGFSYQAHYSGDVNGRGGMLAGTQTGKVGSQSFTRRCQISLGNGRG
jgi:hypothetical protein